MSKSSPPSVTIEVKLGEQPQKLVLAEGTPISKIPLELDSKWREQIMVVVNGKVAGSDVHIKAGDRVVVLPKMAGG